MGSPSPAASKLKKESPSKVVTTTTPHRRTSSVASSCISLESGDQDVQSLNGLGKSPVSESPRTPLEKSGSSPAAIKKRRASIGSPDDLARNLDFGTSTSPSIEEKKHPFLTRGGGHKKVVIPATQTSSSLGSSPVKKGKSTTPPGKEKVVAGRATSVLSPRKLVEVSTKKDMISSPRRSVLALEGTPSMNGSINSEGTSSLVAEKKASPRASLGGKKSSPLPTVKPVASTKVPTNSNGEPGSGTKVSPGKIVLRKSTSSLPSSKSKPGLTSPKSQKSAKTRQDTPSQPGRVKARIEKAVGNEEVSMEPVPVCSENGNETEANVTENIQDGSTLLPSLMEDGNVGDEDMGSLEQGGDPVGFDNDTEMPTSWLSEDLPCMFSSLSHLPEPDDSSSSILDDPPELLDEPEEMISQPKNETAQEPNNATVAAESIMPRSLDAKFIAADSYPSQISEPSFLNLVESEGEPECAYEDATSELESSTKFDNKAKETLIEFPSVEAPETESQSCETMVTTHFEEIISSSLPATESVASDTLTETKLTEEKSSQPFVEALSISSHEELSEVTVDLPKGLQGSDKVSGVYVPEVYISGGGALQEEERRPATEEVASSDSDEDLSCSAQLNLRQSFDDAAAEVDDRICDDIALEERSPATEQEITVTQLEFADETFTPTTHLDKDMMIFDFEEYWTQNVGDESSDAGQNDAEELQQLVVTRTVEEKVLPAIELPVSSLPEEPESIISEPPSPQLDAQGWPRPDSDNGQVDRNQESDEVFHVFEGSDQFSLKDDSSSIVPEELSEPDSSVSPRYTTLETEHWNGVDIGQNLNVLEDKDVEEVPEHQNNTFLVQDESSVVAGLPSVDVDQESLAQAEDLDTPPILLVVASNGLLGANIQHLDDNGASDESVDPEFLPVASQNSSSFETPDVYMAVHSDDSLDMGSENLEVCEPTSVKTADDRDVAELLPESSISRPVSEVAAGTDDSHDLIISKEVGSSMVECDESNILISGKEAESAISLQPVNAISEEEQTEALFLSSLDSKESEAKDSINDHELLRNISEEEPLQCLVGGDQLMSVSKETSSEDETEVLEHRDNLQMLSGAIEDLRPQEMKAQDDERITTQMESHSLDTPNMSEVFDHQPPMPMISEPESLQDAQSLPTGVSTVERSPVFDQEDEISHENFDSKSEAESTASLDEVDVGTDTVITPTITHTDKAEILAEGEATTPAEELSNLTVNEVGEFDNKLGSEEKWGHFGEQSSKAEQEEADSSGPKLSTEDKKDLLFEELMVSKATDVADERHGTTEDLEIHVDESEETTKTISTPVSTPNEIIECHDLPFETSISTDDQEATLETEKALVVSSDATFDDHVIKNEEIVPDHFSSQDLPLVTSNQHTLYATISDVTEVSDLTRFKEGENLNESLEQIPLPKDEDTVVDSPSIHSSLGNMIHTDEKEENSILPCNLEEERASLKQEDEETVVYSPKNSFLASAQAETPDITTHLNGIEGHSNLSWTGDKEEESFNEELKDTVVQNLGSNGIHTASWKDDSEEVSKPLHKDEDMSPKNFDTASLDVEEMEEHAWSAGKEEEERSLNGRLERAEDADRVVKSQFNIEETAETANSDVVDIQNQSKNSWSEDKSLLEDEDTVVYRPNVEEGVEKVEIFHVPEDTVEYRPTVENPGVEKMEVSNVPDVDTTNAEIVDDVEEHKSLNGYLEGESKLEVEDNVSMLQSFVATDLLNANLVVADELENQTEKDEKTLHKEKSTSEVEDSVESSKEQVVAPDTTVISNSVVAPDVTVTSNLVVVGELENQSDKEEETLHEHPEAKSVEEMVVESSRESFVAPNLLNANDAANPVVADELEKQTETFQEKKSIELSSKEPNEVDADAETVDAEDLDEHSTWKTDNKDSSLNGTHVVSNEVDAGAETVDAEDLDEHSTWKTDNKDSSLNGSHVVSNEDNAGAEIVDAEDLDEHPTWKTNNKDSSLNGTHVVSNEVNAGAETLDAEDLDEHRTWKTNNKDLSLNGIRLEEQSMMLEAQDTVVDSVKQDSVQCLPEVNGAIQSYSGTADLTDKAGLEPHESSQAVHSTPEVNGAIQSSSGTANLTDKVALEPHESSQAVHSAEIAKSLNVPGVVQTDAADAKDCAGSDKPIDASSNDEKLKNSGNVPVNEINLELSSTAPTGTSPQTKDCASVYTKPMDTSNGENLKNSNAPADETNPTDTATDLEGPQTPTEPQSPTGSTLYPLKSQPPFSGSQQDRLWEEQAEAYNSGQGTPRNGAQAGAPCDSPAKVVPVQCEDQIEPVTPSNGNHAAVVVTVTGGAENGASTVPTVQDEQPPLPKERNVNGKEKLHTPLRSLLLEDAGGHGDTPNGVVTSSPSFIRRLFRVMSTSSRSSEREAKLKRSSSSMWVSCLGSPQVQQ